MLETVKKAQIPIYIYLHFHWDREWFMSFNTSRALLMDRTKKTLSALESGELPNFFLDGQAVVLEDLIEIDPDLFPRIQSAMAAGKLSAGPWYCLPDQSLIGGESLLRNLKIGMEITRKFGPPTMNGYNPDTFCHVQDLPRILRGMGISTALVLRGVPPLKDTNVFWWESPDGSRVLTYLLNKGLTHPVFHRSADEKKIAEDLLARWDLRSVGEKTVPMLYSAGGEGMQPPGDLAKKLEKVNELLPKNCYAKVVSMDSFLADLERWAADKDLPVITGDLRDNRSISELFPAYVLDGVSSTRLYLKRDNALAEHRLIRITEPLFAMLHAQGMQRYPENELRYAWKLLMQNHPHDSICGCSIDVVHQEMRTRTKMFNAFLDGLDLIAAENIAEYQGDDSNPKQKSILPPVTALQPGDPDNTYNRLSIYNTSSFAHNAPIKMTWLTDPEKDFAPPSVQFQIESESYHPNQLFQSAGGFYYRKVNRVEGWIFPESEVPGNGIATVAFDAASVEGESSKLKDISCAQSSNVIEMDNGLLKVKVDGAGSLICVSTGGDRKEFVLGHEIVDVGDGGDTYNFDPLLNDEPIKAKFVSAKAGIKGALVSTMLLTYELDIPESLDSIDVTDESLEKGRSKNTLKHTIKTTVALKKGVPILFFDTTFENFSADHRLSVRFNSVKNLEQTFSESHFSLARQPISPKPPDLPVPVGHEILPESYFSQRFFIAAGQMILHRGLPEYRSFDDYVELTLMRSTSWLSRGRLRTRGGGAGPWDPTPEANCYGVNNCEYAWAFIGDTEEGELKGEQIKQAYKLADIFEGRLSAFLLGKFTGASSQSLLRISSATIYMTAMFIDRGKLCVRLLNLMNSSQKASIKTPLEIMSAHETNMLDEDLKEIAIEKSGTITTLKIDFKANELLTLALELPTTV